jgi:hypothetical protein
MRWREWDLGKQAAALLGRARRVESCKHSIRDSEVNGQATHNLVLRVCPNCQATALQQSSIIGLSPSLGKLLQLLLTRSRCPLLFENQTRVSNHEAVHSNENLAISMERASS